MAEISTHTVPFQEAKHDPDKQNFPAFHTVKHGGLKIVYCKLNDSVWYNNITRLG